MRNSGQECPTPQSLSVAAASGKQGVEAASAKRPYLYVQATPEERVVIERALRSVGAGSSGAERPGRAWSEPGKKLVTVLFVVATVAAGVVSGGGLAQAQGTLHNADGGADKEVMSGTSPRRVRVKRRLEESESVSEVSEGLGRKSECALRAECCEHRMENGECQDSGRRCRWLAGPESVTDMLVGKQGIHQEIVSVRGEFQELRSAKQNLERMLAEGLFGFTQKVDAHSFKVLCAILAEGDVAKASGCLGMPDASVRTVMRQWRRMGREYQAMLDLVRWRKAVGRKERVALNEKVLLERTDRTDYPGLLADVLDGLLSMTEENWQERCEELAELLRPVVSGS